MGTSILEQLKQSRGTAPADYQGLIDQAAELLEGLDAAIANARESLGAFQPEASVSAGTLTVVRVSG